MITFFIINLGLVKTYDKMVKSVKNNPDISPQILEEVQDAMKEAADNVADPYHDYMRKSK